MKVAELVKGVQEIMGDGYTVESISVTKNNGVVLDGITIRKGDDMVSPTIYADDTTTPEQVVERYNTSTKDNEIMSINFKELINKEYILKNVFPALCNKQNNESMLNDTVYTLYADLVILYRVKIYVSNGTATFLVDKNNLKHFDLTEQDIHNAAMRNVKGTARIMGLGTALASHGAPIDEDEFNEACPMKILTNDAFLWGAGAILDDEVAEHVTGAYIIPCSVNELIIIPEEYARDISSEDLKGMVGFVNATELTPQEVLSDNVYVYRNNRLEVA